MRAFWICLCAGLALPADAGQPISESMVDCAALFDLTNRWYPERADSENAVMLAHATDQFLDAALREARIEGRGGPEGYVMALFAAKAAKWDGKPFTFPFSQEFRDWAGYCRSLARHRGIALTPN